MTNWDDILKPAPVYCDYCGGVIVTTVRKQRVRTPLGNRTLTTHDNSYCAREARVRCDGTPIKVRETGQDKVNTHLRGRT